MSLVTESGNVQNLTHEKHTSRVRHLMSEGADTLVS